MNNLFDCVRKMEKSAVTFIKRGLGSVAYILLLLCVRSKIMLPSDGVERVLFCKELLECITYILLSVTLIICGGLFMDYAMKRERDS